MAMEMAPQLDDGEGPRVSVHADGPKCNRNRRDEATRCRRRLSTLPGGWHRVPGPPRRAGAIDRCARGTRSAVGLRGDRPDAERDSDARPLQRGERPEGRAGCDPVGGREITGGDGGRIELGERGDESCEREREPNRPIAHERIKSGVRLTKPVSLQQPSVAEREHRPVVEHDLLIAGLWPIAAAATYSPSAGRERAHRTTTRSPWRWAAATAAVRWSWAMRTQAYTGSSVRRRTSPARARQSSSGIQPSSCSTNWSRWYVRHSVRAPRARRRACSFPELLPVSEPGGGVGGSPHGGVLARRRRRAPRTTR